MELDLQYLIEVLDCSSWMNSVYCNFSARAVFVSHLSLSNTIHKYIPGQVLNSKNGHDNKDAWKAAIERSTSIANKCQYLPENFPSKFVSSVKSAYLKHA